MSDNSPEVALATLSQELTHDAIVSWSDERRKEFTSTFDARVRASQFILLQTAKYILAAAEKRQYISSKHVESFKTPDISVSDDGGYRSDSRYYAVGGRNQNELLEIAKGRADKILEALPPLRKAVQLISPAISKLIGERDRLLADGQELMKQVAELSGPLSMSDFPKSMTLGEFQDVVEARETQREAILERLDKMGKKGEELEKNINKFLYSGLPGLSDAVVAAAKANTDRAVALSAMNRRVSEQVQFGDSSAALEILASFEQDEQTVSADIQAQFDNALEVLKAAGQNAKKKLKGKG